MRSGQSWRPDRRPVTYHRDGTSGILEALHDWVEVPVSYRQLDYWIRQGWVRLAYKGRGTGGTGDARKITQAEARAIMEFAVEYDRIQQQLAGMKSGEWFARAVQRAQEELDNEQQRDGERSVAEDPGRSGGDPRDDGRGGFVDD